MGCPSLAGQSTLEVLEYKKSPRTWYRRHCCPYACCGCGDALSFQRKGKGGRKEIGFLRGTNETYECPEENKQFAKWNGYINVTQVPDL